MMMIKCTIKNKWFKWFIKSKCDYKWLKTSDWNQQVIKKLKDLKLLLKKKGWGGEGGMARKEHE